ncbi:MAG: translocation/assembly module TamB domain-containing protein [Bacteroidota bacterium]
MTKLLKLLWNVVLFLFEMALLVVILFFFMIRTSEFQTYLGKLGSSYFSKQLQTNVSIGKIDIVFFDRVYFDDLMLEDQRGDTLAAVGTFYANVADFDIEQLDFSLDEVGVSNAAFRLDKKAGDQNTNLQFLIDYFANDTPSAQPDFSLRVAHFYMENSQFVYNDNHHEVSDFGVDYNHLELKALNLTANAVHITPDKYKAHIKQMETKERSGFVLSAFQGKAEFSRNQGLKLRNGKIKTPASTIELPRFELLAEEMSDFSAFTERVALNSRVSSEALSLYDVSLFAPALRGMEDIVTLKVRTTDPVDRMQLHQLMIGYRENTYLKGDFALIDFKELSTENINQYVNGLSIDINELQQLQLPDSSPQRTLNLPESLAALDRVALVNTRISGSLHDLDVEAAMIQTNLGNISSGTPLHVTSDSTFNHIRIAHRDRKNTRLRFHQFDIGRLLRNKQLGKLEGETQLQQINISPQEISVDRASGTFRNLRIDEYAYNYVIFDQVNYRLVNSRIPQNSLRGKAYIRDEHLDLSFDGFAQVGQQLAIDAAIDLECAHLEAISSQFKDRGTLYAKVKVDAEGENFKAFKGDVNMDTVFYEENGERFHTRDFNASIERSDKKDRLMIRSELLDADVDGQMEFNKIGKNVQAELNKIFPSFIPGYDHKVQDTSFFDYAFEIKALNDLLAVVYPELKISKGTTLDGRYLGEKQEMSLNVHADYFEYQQMRFEAIDLVQDVYNDELLALYDIQRVYVSDSLTFKAIHFTGLTSKGFMDFQLLFHDTDDSRSNLEWYTHLFDKDGFDIDILPSYFTLNDHRWELNDRAHVNYTDDCFFIEDFKLEHDDQYIAANGQLSNYPFDHLNMDVMNLDLADVGTLLGSDTDLQGVANLVGYISTPFTNPTFQGDAVLQDFFINQTEVGTVSFGTDYEATNNNIRMFGDIIFKGSRTFAFDGDYIINTADEIEDSLDFEMKMNGTDISVVNEFLDPEVVNEVGGFLEGGMALTGTVKEPLLEGKVDFRDGIANLAILGADMYYEGEIESVKDGFYINNMPLTDEEGNTGYITGSLFHDNFQDFFFELIMNLEDHPVKRDPQNPAKPLAIDRFKVMKTNYSEDDPYYGDAFITGVANISGYANNLSIDVNATTQRGTKIFFPMYGPTTIEEEGYISFKTAGEDTLETKENRVDLTGVDLTFDFNVTDDAQVKLIFDEDIGDEISARGEGDLQMGVDQYGELTLSGIYTVTDGVYNFAMGPYRQNFLIEPGGTLQWTGDPYAAMLDIKTYYRTTANLSVVMPDVIENKTSDNELILSYLYLDGSIMNPQISFDLEAPKASEAGKAVISRIRSDQDELNKQFFSILISRSFLPLAGEENRAGGSGGALLDLAATQINSLLNKMSQSYKMNVNLENDQLSGQFSGEFGMSKNFLNDRLQVSGSVGVGSVRDQSGSDVGAPGQNTVIGDVEIEYYLNEKGSFRIHGFNESNNNTVIQNNNQGLFTQGVGISYKEDFHTLEDFKLLQFFANLFRKEEVKIDFPGDDRREPIPEEYLE